MRQLTQALPLCYFNSQPHKEADGFVLDCVQKELISTHSLTRRLTEIYTRKRNPSEISTHSLTRRLTKQKDMLTMIWSISTHSLTRRLTKNKGFFLINYTFQLTASQGG